MPFQEYKAFNFRPASTAIIKQANRIIIEYQEQGYDLTLRQIYYQFVARGIIPNSDREYKKLGSVINDGRLAGLIDWNAITDRTRPNRGLVHWENPQERLEAAAQQFHIDTRADQDYYIEVWVEKDALVGVLEQVCDTLDVPYLSCRGYVSQSSMWEAAQRFIEKEESGKQTVLIYLGDHDPSGINMPEDIQKRLVVFQSTCHVSRIALSMEQIKHFKPPPNPAKETDSRCAGYKEKYGDESWELDALEPQVISALIKACVDALTDVKRIKKLQSLQSKHRKDIQWAADNWTTILPGKRKR